MANLSQTDGLPFFLTQNFRYVGSSSRWVVVRTCYGGTLEIPKFSMTLKGRTLQGVNRCWAEVESKLRASRVIVLQYTLA